MTEPNSAAAKHSGAGAISDCMEPQVTQRDDINVVQMVLILLVRSFGKKTLLLTVTRPQYDLPSLHTLI